MGDISLLFDSEYDSGRPLDSSAPPFFHNLHLDTIVSDMLRGREEYELAPYFFTPLQDLKAVQYRSDIMEDIDRSRLVQPLETFTRDMFLVRKYLNNSNELTEGNSKHKWLLDAAYIYVHALADLQRIFTTARLDSQGLQRFRQRLTNDVHSTSFTQFSNETNDLYQEFDRISYSLMFHGNRLKIQLDDQVEEDYFRTLSKVLKQEPSHARVRLFTGSRMNGLEEAILAMIRDQHPEPFDQLSLFYTQYPDFIAPYIMTFEREVQFYLAALAYYHKLETAGHHYTYARLTEDRIVQIEAGYDLALAHSALQTGRTIVCNDAVLSQDERICTITGANQGGKTTFIRSIGQVFYLASIGCPVPCRAAKLYVCDRIFTHFATDENDDMQTGKLKDELVRLKPMMDQATSRSVVLLNELFSTTTHLDAHAMGNKTIERFLDLNSLCFFATHITELAAHAQTVSLVAMVDDAVPPERTFRIERKPADGMAHATALIDKYRLTMPQLKERIQR